MRRTTITRRGQLVLAVAGLMWVAGPALVWAGAAEGKAVFEKQCKTCHSIAGQGGPMAKTGGPLDGVGAKRDGAWLSAFVKDPRSKKPDSKMARLRLTDQQLEDVVAYLLTLKTPAPAN